MLVNALGPMALIDCHPENFQFQLRLFPAPYRIHYAELPSSCKAAFSGTATTTLAVNRAPCQTFASALEATRRGRIVS